MFRFVLPTLLMLASASAFTPTSLTSVASRSFAGPTSPLFACRTPSVERVADKSVSAMEQIEKLEAALKAQEAVKQAEFQERINKSLAAAKITDARVIGQAIDIKTEYTSEFSLDKIANVVIAALKSAQAATSKDVPNPSLSDEAVASYTDLVNTVAQAAKSSSDSASSMSYQMTRISMGVYAFLYATSTNIQEDETFGREAVTSTAVYYQLIQSIDDVKQGLAFDLAVFDANLLISFKKLQAASVDDLASGDITIGEWMTLDASYTAIIKSIQERIDDYGWSEAKRTSYETTYGLTTSEKVVRNAVELLQEKNAQEYAPCIDVQNQRLGEGYY